MNFDKYEKILPLESSELNKDLFYKVINDLSPDLFHSFNLFMDWRFNSPDVSMSEYYGGNKNEDILNDWYKNQQRDSEEIAVKKAIKNIDKFIPKYLEWYVNLVTEWE